MHQQTLRTYEAKGLVRPRRTPGNTRLYSERDLDRLREIQRLTSSFGLNLAGVERVLELEDQLLRLRERIDRLERELRREADRHERPRGLELLPLSESVRLISLRPNRSNQPGKGGPNGL